MAFSKITHRQRRRRGLRGKPLEQRRGFWGHLRNPNTLRLTISVGYMIYRTIRYVLMDHQVFK